MSVVRKYPQKGEIYWAVDGLQRWGWFTCKEDWNSGTYWVQVPLMEEDTPDKNPQGDPEAHFTPEWVNKPPSHFDKGAIEYKYPDKGQWFWMENQKRWVQLQKAVPTGPKHWVMIEEPDSLTEDEPSEQVVPGMVCGLVLGQYQKDMLKDMIKEAIRSRTAEIPPVPTKGSVHKLYQLCCVLDKLK